jgi:hypothetical protein
VPRDDATTESARAAGHAAFPGDGTAPLVDEHTWNDLDMDAVTGRIDRTVSIPGRMALRRLLRSAVASTGTLTERDALIGALAPGRDATRILRGELVRLDRDAGAEDLASLLWEHPPEGLPHGGAYRLLALLAIASVALALWIGGKAVFLPMLMFAFNGAVHFHIRVRWQTEIQGLRYAGRLRACAHRLVSIPEPLLDAHQRRLSTAVHDTSSVARRVAFLSSGDVTGLLYAYFSIFFLLEPQAYQWLVRHWARGESGLREIFLTVGELDAFASVGQLRSDLPTWCRPDLEPGPARLEMTEGVHPLLDDPVPASLTLSGRGCLITGANMSGKSTLLRTLGINALFARTIFTCTARRYRATPLGVISSMRVGDDILAGRSRYLAEAERLLALVRKGDVGEPALCLIDELLSGTNAAERLAASRAILDYLAGRGLLVVAATHDLELTESLRDRYDSYFFADDVSRDDLRFDYRLRPGVAETRNAIRLLERLGYPSTIVARARGDGQ